MTKPLPPVSGSRSAKAQCFRLPGKCLSEDFSEIAVEQ
jgi:hypothetical protein